MMVGRERAALLYIGCFIWFYLTICTFVKKQRKAKEILLVKITEKLWIIMYNPELEFSLPFLPRIQAKFSLHMLDWLQYKTHFLYYIVKQIFNIFDIWAWFQAKSDELICLGTSVNKDQCSFSTSLPSFLFCHDRDLISS